MNKHLLIIVIALITLPAGADVVFTGTNNQASSEFFRDIRGSLFFRTSVVDPTPGVFDEDFSTKGEETFSITWKAPAGQFFEVTPTPGFSLADYQLIFRFTVEDIFFNTGSLETTLTPTLINPSGATPTLELAQLALSGPGSTGMGGGVFYGIEPGQTYRFAGLTATGTIPADYDHVFSDVPIDGFGIYAELSVDNRADAPAPWIRIVPEPSSLALLALGGLLVARRRHPFIHCSFTPSGQDAATFNHGETIP